MRVSLFWTRKKTRVISPYKEGKCAYPRAVFVDNSIQFNSSTSNKRGRATEFGGKEYLKHVIIKDIFCEGSAFTLCAVL